MQSTGICVQVYSSIPYIQQKLALSGFKFKEKYVEYDNYFTHFNKSEIKKISYSQLMSNTILLRTIKSRKNEEHLMIYKDKTLNSQNEVIKEEKVQTKVLDMSEAKRIFSISGLNNWCRIVVDETEYEKGSLIVSIQSVSGLGSFLEITSSGEKNGTGELKFRELVYIANSLGLDLGKDFSAKKNYMLYKKNN